MHSILENEPGEVISYVNGVIRPVYQNQPEIVFQSDFVLASVDQQFATVAFNGNCVLETADAEVSWEIAFQELASVHSALFTWGFMLGKGEEED